MTEANAPALYRRLFERPIFIVSTPRSGSSLLFETLANAPNLFTVGGESHGVIERIPSFSLVSREWSSNRLTADDAQTDPVEQLARSFYEKLRDRDGRPAFGRVRMLEKTPKNALRVPFFDSVWPDAMFVYLYRDVRQTLASMIEAWLSGRFRTYPRLPGWDGLPWSLLLVPGWRSLIGKPLPQIVAEQWAITTGALIQDLESIPIERLRIVIYGELVGSPQMVMHSLARSLGLGWDRPLQSKLPLSRHTVSLPEAEKWRTIEDVIKATLPIVEEADGMARAFIERFTTRCSQATAKGHEGRAPK